MQRTIPEEDPNSPVKSAEVIPMVLIVDQSELSRTGSKNVLTESFGNSIHIHMEANGEKGLEFFRQNQRQVAFLISDVALEGMDGPTMLTEIHALEPAAACLLMTRRVRKRVMAEISRQDVRELFATIPYMQYPIEWSAPVFLDLVKEGIKAFQARHDIVISGPPSVSSCG
jgi:response regulator RpfG family c-di-GMP phosphodiesterase